MPAQPRRAPSDSGDGADGPLEPRTARSRARRVAPRGALDAGARPPRRGRVHADHAHAAGVDGGRFRGGERDRTRSVGGRTPVWRFASGLAGAAAIVLVVVTMGIVLSQTGTGPGTTATPTPTPSPSPSHPSPRSPSAPPSPAPTTLGTLSARSLVAGHRLRPRSRVTEAFGSIWVANIHANEVRRYDPATMAELARIDVPSAAWFAVADGALWVTHQNGTGLSRIDPASNTVVANVGDVPPCAEPVVAFDSVWQSACDARVILRIDPATNEVQDSIPSDGHLLPDVRRRPADRPRAGRAREPRSGDAGRSPRSRTRTWPEPRFWRRTATRSGSRLRRASLRVDPASGRTIATLDYPGVRAISFANGSAWLTTAEAAWSRSTLRPTSPAGRSPCPATPLCPSSPRTRCGSRTSPTASSGRWTCKPLGLYQQDWLVKDLTPGSRRVKVAPVRFRRQAEPRQTTASAMPPVHTR